VLRAKRPAVDERRADRRRADHAGDVDHRAGADRLDPSRATRGCADIGADRNDSSVVATTGPR
jgi:hypothetical protein